MLEQQEPTSYVNPYKFNAKELDSKTGLYYYGARYYNPRISFWYGVDPLAEVLPVHSFYECTFVILYDIQIPQGYIEIEFSQFERGRSEKSC